MESGEHAGPVRMCVICRRQLPKAQLTRYVRGPLGEEHSAGGTSPLVLDTKKRMHGRGHYVCGQDTCNQRMGRYAPRPKRPGRAK